MKKDKQKLIAIDVETTGLDWKRDKLHGLGVAYEEDETRYHAPSHVDRDTLALLRDPTVAKVGQNLRFDLRFLWKAGIEVAGPTYDTKILASLVNENMPHGLKQLAQKYLGSWSLEGKSELDSAISKAGLKHVGQLCALDMAEANGKYSHVIGKYCEEDCNNTYKLAYVLMEKILACHKAWKKLGAVKTPWDYFKEEAMPLEAILLQMELKGIRIDFQAASILTERCQVEKASILDSLQKLAAPYIENVEKCLYENALSKRKSEAGKAKVLRSSEKYKTSFNWGSNAHLGHLIYKELGVPEGLVNYTNKGLPSTSDKDLGVIRHLTEPTTDVNKVLVALSSMKKVDKLLSTYIGNGEEGMLSKAHEGRLHPSYLQVGHSKEGGKGGTVTGRLSSQDPNIQNIPRSAGIKKFFVPDPGKVFVYADYSQLELRIAAHLSGDPELVNGFVKKLDLHMLTASDIFSKPAREISKEERQVGKTINFATIFDANAYRLMEELNKGGANYTVERCAEMREAFFERYHVYKDYLNEIKAFLVANGNLISETGRVRRIPEIAYGQYLQWRGRKFVGTDAMRLKLLHQPNEEITEAELFNRAKKKFNHAIKQGYNFPIQSLGASIAKRAMLALAASGADIVTQVHDSIIVQVQAHKAPLAARKMREVMETVYPLKVPLVAETKLLKSFDETDTITVSDLNKEIPDNGNVQKSATEGRPTNILTFSKSGGRKAS